MTVSICEVDLQIGRYLFQVVRFSLGVVTGGVQQFGPYVDAYNGVTEPSKPPALAPRTFNVAAKGRVAGRGRLFLRHLAFLRY